MGIFDKAKEMLADEKKTDAVLDKAESFAKDKLGQDKHDQVSKVRDAIDDRIGSDNPDDDRQNRRPGDNGPETPGR